MLVSDDLSEQQQVVFSKWLHAPLDIANINTHGMAGLDIAAYVGTDLRHTPVTTLLLAAECRLQM